MFPSQAWGSFHGVECESVLQTVKRSGAAMFAHKIWFSFSTICFNFWKSSNLPSYPLLSVQFSGIKETHIIVQPASPSSHRLFYIKNETMSQLCTNTSFSLLSSPGKHSVPLIFMNLPPLRTSYEWNSDGVFFLSFFLPVVKYTQHKIDHLSIFSAQVSGIKSIHLLCSHHHHASPSSFFLKPEAPLDRTHLPLPQPLTTTTLLSVFMDLPTLQT